MKRILLASTMLVAGAGMAAADVSISGYGRFGLSYYSDTDPGFNKTVFTSRLRMTLSGTMETDGGVTFGGKLRVQYNQGDEYADFNTAQYWIAYEGLTVQFGNVDTAFDSVALNYDSEMGFQDNSVGDTYDWDFFAYDSNGSYGGMWESYVGVSAFYSINGINLYLSYVNPDQYSKDLPAWADKELGIAADWSNGQFTVAGAYTNSAGGIKNHNIAFLGGAYNFGDGNVGLNLYNFDYPVGDDVRQVTLYGNYTFGATTVRAVITDVDEDGLKTGYGIGADYDLGNGARISGTYQRDVWGDKFADLGVRFNF